jgi:hypothetical protein
MLTQGVLFDLRLFFAIEKRGVKKGRCQLSRGVFLAF